jgi:hypothetical protein
MIILLNHKDEFVLVILFCAYNFIKTTSFLNFTCHQNLIWVVKTAFILADMSKKRLR